MLVNNSLIRLIEKTLPRSHRVDCTSFKKQHTHTHTPVSTKIFLRDVRI